MLKFAGLAIVQMGSRPDSDIYIRMKQKAAKEIGVFCELFQLPASAPQEQLLTLLAQLNTDPRFHGIIVQVPLPDHISTETVVAAVSPDKDVDGFSPECMGRLATLDRDPCFIPCTPKGVLRLLTAYGIDVEGKKIVIIGRSRVVGLPLALLLVRHDATVTVCHRKTVNIAAETRTADILIAAAGQPEVVRADWVKPGAIVIDVGINHKPCTVSTSSVARSGDDSTPSAGNAAPAQVMCGDVDWQGVYPIAGLITPVPGGVGPMTVAMLLENVVAGARMLTSDWMPTDASGASSPHD